jgi:hypothetical protein
VCYLLLRDELKWCIKCKLLSSLIVALVAHDRSCCRTCSHMSLMIAHDRSSCLLFCQLS